MRTDRTLQSIVDKVFPQFAQKEEVKAKPAAPPPRFDDGAPPPAAKKARPGPQAAAPVEEDAPEEISFSLQQASDPLTAAAAAKLEKPYLRTSSRLTVKHLKKYRCDASRTGRLTYTPALYTATPATGTCSRR